MVASTSHYSSSSSSSSSRAFRTLQNLDVPYCSGKFALQTRYSVEHLPWFVLLSPSGKVTVKNGVDDIVGQGEAVWKHWTAVESKASKNGDD
jgi:hypothetical protein